MSTLGPNAWLNKLSSLFNEKDANQFAATLMSGEGGLGQPAFYDIMNRTRGEIPTQNTPATVAFAEETKKKKPTV